MRDAMVTYQDPDIAAALADDSFGVPALDDWYEKAISEGMGFKNEADRAAYLASLGDPLSHPMFATSTEELASHPLTEAFRLLREEDKSPEELCLLYKDEGNEWMKKGDRKGWKEALLLYLHALSFVKKEDEEEWGSEKRKQLLSVVHSNIALAHLNLKNFVLCSRSAEKAILLWPGNVKAHYRRCKALASLHRHSAAVAACKEANAAGAGAADISAIEQKSLAVLAQRRREREVRLQALEEERQGWRDAWTICHQHGAALSPAAPNSAPPAAQLQLGGKLMPFYDRDSDGDGEACFPCVLVYPEYQQCDAIRGCRPEDLLVEHLALVFPDDAPPVAWDVRGDYRFDRLIVFARVLEGSSGSGCGVDAEAWDAFCLDSWTVRRGLPGALTLLEQEQQQQEEQRSKLDAAAAETTGGEDDEERAVEALTAATRRVEAALSKASKETAGEETLVELGLGCSLGAALKLPGLRLVGGLLQLLVFVRGSAAHTNFLSTAAASSKGGKVLVVGCSLEDLRRRGAN